MQEPKWAIPALAVAAILVIGLGWYTSPTNILPTPEMAQVASTQPMQPQQSPVRIKTRLTGVVKM